MLTILKALCSKRKTENPKILFHNTTSSSKNQSAMTSMVPLSASFTLGSCDVICARGKEVRNHGGNKRYRTIIEKSLDRYAEASTKYEKSSIVSDIVETIRQTSSNGGFVKQEDGIWYEVGDHLAREKVGQNLRDSLHKMYRSSTKSKRRRRGVVSAGMVADVESLIRSNKIVSRRFEKLSADMKERGDAAAPEVFVSQIFTQANSEILEAFKKDSSLLSKFKLAEEQQKICVCVE
jgi:hypothetical protein